MRKAAPKRPDRPAADYLAALLARLADRADSPRVRAWAGRLRKGEKRK